MASHTEFLDKNNKKKAKNMVTFKSNRDGSQLPERVNLKPRSEQGLRSISKLVLEQNMRLRIRTLYFDIYPGTGTDTSVPG